MRPMTQEALRRSLGIIAVMAGEKTGVQVVLKKAGTASTDGKKITIPAIELKTQADWEMVEGFVYHESGHIKHTDFGLIQRFSGDPVLHKIWNFLEDVWTDRMMEEDLNGLKKVYQRLAVHIKALEDHSSASLQTGGQTGILNHIYYALQYLVRNYEVYRDTYEKSAEALKVAHGEDFLDILEGICLEAKTCSSTERTADLAQEIYDFLKDESQKPPMPQPQSQPPDPDKKKPDDPQNQSSGQSNQGHSSDKGQGKNSDDSKPSDTNSGDKNHAGNSASMKPDPGASTANAPNAKAKSNHKPISWSDLEKEAGTLQDTGSILQDWINNMPQDNGAWIPELPKVVRSPEEKMDDGEVSSAATGLAALRQAVLADTFRQARAGYSGKRLCARKLAGLTTGTNLRVFTSPQPQRALDTYIHLLVDVSLSMRGDQLKKANLVTLGLQQCLQGVPGIALEMTGFSSSGGSAIVVPHSGKPNMGFIIHGGTPLAPALDWTLAHAVAAKEKRKIIFVITDGAPDAIPPVKKSLATIKSCGVQTIGILIGKDIPKLFGLSVEIQNVSQLSAALNSIWVNLLYPEI